MFSSLNFAWVLFFVLELWKVCFSFLNFEKVHFYTWISSLDFFYKRTETKFMCKNEFFQNLWMKNELFKIQKQKTKLVYSLKMKTIFWSFFFKKKSKKNKKETRFVFTISNPLKSYDTWREIIRAPMGHVNNLLGRVVVKDSEPFNSVNWLFHDCRWKLRTSLSNSWSLYGLSFSFLSISSLLYHEWYQHYIFLIPCKKPFIGIWPSIIDGICRCSLILMSQWLFIGNK